MTWLWGCLGAVALLWPDRVSGPFDGVPLDQVGEAILLGVAFPALWWFQPQFLRTRAARTTIVALISWKVIASVTLNDPARYDSYAIPVVGGGLVAVLALAGVPRVRALPLGLVLFFLGSVAGALVARGSAYAGRFSLHVIPVTCALSVSAIAALTSHVNRHVAASSPHGSRLIRRALSD